MSEPGSRTMVSVWRAGLSVLASAVVVLVCALVGCGGCGPGHGLPDASVFEASLADAGAAACEWRLGAPRRMPRGFTLGDPSPRGQAGFPTGDAGAWVSTQDYDGIWLNHLDVDGQSLAPPARVSLGPVAALDLNVDVVPGQVGGLVIYDGCRAQGDCEYFAFAEMYVPLVPQLRAFDANGTLGPILWLDVPGSINERLVGSAAGQSYLVAVANRIVQPVGARGQALGAPLPSPFTTAPLAAFPIGSSSALFILQPRGDASVWLARVDSAGRMVGEVQSELRSPSGPLWRAEMNASRDRIAVVNSTQVDVITPDGRLLATFNSPEPGPKVMYVGDTLFVLPVYRVEPRLRQLLRLDQDGMWVETVDLAELALDTFDRAYLAGYVSTGSGLLLFLREGAWDDPDKDLLVYPVGCLPAGTSRGEP